MSISFTSRLEAEEPDPRQVKKKQCMWLLDQGCLAPGVLKVAVNDFGLSLRWSMPASLLKRPSKSGIAFALNLAEGSSAYSELRDAEAKHNWVEKTALGADQWNRGIAMIGVLKGVVSAFHGFDKVCYHDAPEARGKAYPRATNADRSSMYMPGDPGAPEFNVFKIDAYACDFTEGGTASLNMEKPPLRALISEIDQKHDMLFLKDTCWSFEFYDGRTKGAPESEEEKELPVPKRSRH